MTVSVVVVGEANRRTTTTTDVALTDPSGAPPDVGDDTARTTTDEKVTIYVIADDIDPDGDLDYTSVSIVGGGWLADSVTARPDGTIAYEPFGNLSGVDQVVYQVCDDARRCDTGVLAVEIRE
jgi:hypothetical protein